MQKQNDIFCHSAKRFYKNLFRKKFHFRAAGAMIAGGNRSSLTEARAEKAWRNQGTAFYSK